MITNCSIWPLCHASSTWHIQAQDTIWYLRLTFVIIAIATINLSVAGHAFINLTLSVGVFGMYMGPGLGQNFSADVLAADGTRPSAGKVLTGKLLIFHDDVIKWKHFLRYWPFVQGIHRSPVNSLHKSQWRIALMFSLICAWINHWLNNPEAGDLRWHHYDIIVMCSYFLPSFSDVYHIWWQHDFSNIILLNITELQVEFKSWVLKADVNFIYILF